MKKAFYYSLDYIFYNILMGINTIWEYFNYKAEKIAELEYERDIKKFYEG